jgi:glycosyltransferase involved in cell wall biosynthesis
MPHPLRILTCLHSFEPGGVERVALRLQASWVGSGVDAHLVMGRADGAMREEAKGLSYRVLASGRISTGWFETLWMILHLPNEIRRIRPDVLFCAGNSYTIVAVAMRLLLGNGCPPIVAKISNDLHRQDMPLPVRYFYRLWLRIQGRWIDHFVAMAPAMSAEIRQLMQVPDSRVTVIEDPSLDRAALARLASTRDKGTHTAPGRRFLAVGRLVPQKNFALLINAFAQTHQTYDLLTILGEGPARPALERQISALGLVGRVELPGHVSNFDLWLAGGTAFVLSSDYEGVPAVIIEALAAGIPIIATDCSASMGELLGGGRYGTLVPPGSLAELTRAMLAVTDRPHDVTGARQMAARFSVDCAAEGYLRLMRQSMRSGRAHENDAGVHSSAADSSPR